MLISSPHNLNLCSDSQDTRFLWNVFEAVQKTRSTRFIGSKATQLHLVVLNPIKHSFSLFNHYINRYPSVSMVCFDNAYPLDWVIFMHPLNNWYQRFLMVKFFPRMSMARPPCGIWFNDFPCLARLPQHVSRAFSRLQVQHRFACRCCHRLHD